MDAKIDVKTYVINLQLEHLMYKMFEFDCMEELTEKQQEEYNAILDELQKLIKEKKGV